MNTSALLFAITLLEALPRLVTASAEVLTLINTTRAALRQMQDSGREPTDAEWRAMHAVIETLTKRIEAEPSNG